MKSSNFGHDHVPLRALSQWQVECGWLQSFKREEERGIEQGMEWSTQRGMERGIEKFMERA